METAININARVRSGMMTKVCIANITLLYQITNALEAESKCEKVDQDGGQPYRLSDVQSSMVKLYTHHKLVFIIITK